MNKRIQRVELQERDGIIWASYLCIACAEYVVNKPLSWECCTPELCHACTNMDKVLALVSSSLKGGA